MPAPHLTRPALVDCPPDGTESFLRATMHGFHRDWDADALVPASTVLETSRSFGHQVEGHWVSTCSSYGRELAVPGGRVPVAAVTWVTVQPSYRRRGLLDELMEHQLATVPEPVALLWASESGIYGRYGYGAAIPAVRVSGATRETAFRPDVDLGGGSVEEVGAAEFRAVVVPLRDRLLTERPGALTRPERWWDVFFDDRPSRHLGESDHRYAVHHAVDGSVDGYLAFRLSSTQPGLGPGMGVRVTTLEATTPTAHARLWRFVLDLDLVRTVEATTPLDEPLPHLLADPQLLSTAVADAAQLRLVDVAAALAARRYAAAVDLVLEVHDRQRSVNDGRFRLQGGPDGAAVTRGGGNPHLVLGVRELGAAYLGGTSPGTLQRAGLLEERTPGAVAALGAALTWSRMPFCVDYF